MLGSGLLQGLAVTAKNFAGSFHDPTRLVTTEYPEQRTALPEAYRSFPFLVADNESDLLGSLRCVACLTCEKECPAQCIAIEKSKDKKPDASGRMQFYPAAFDIDFSVCMGCQICVEVCPFDSIKMDQIFELAAPNRGGELVFGKARLAKSNRYYHEIRPTEAAEVDARLTAERQAAEEKARAAAAKAAAPKTPAPSAPSAPAPSNAQPSTLNTQLPPPRPAAA